MTRRTFFAAAPFLAAAPNRAPALQESHFPDRLHQFVWRNWELVDIDRMARVVGCSPRDLLAVGQSMGLPPKPDVPAGQARRTYITVIRQNWHLLPEDQLVALLGWSRDKFAYTLKEDDFLDVKLGPKPDCPRVAYTGPSPQARRIRRILRQELGTRLRERGEPPLAFIERLSRSQVRASAPAGGLRMVYSYFALYGDPLAEPDLDPFPDGYLDSLARVGVNAVWMQCVLRVLERSEERLANLAKLVERLGRTGMRLYLYLNEPRAMPEDFYRDRPHLKGAESRGLYAMCTSQPEVRQWITDSVARIFQRVPGLSGVFSITMSENFTHCFSKYKPESCPRCSKRKSWEVAGEVLEAIRAGVRRASPTADVIVWDWGWPDDLCHNLIPALPRDCKLMSVSEWSQPVERGGVKTRVGEYSISVVGPGPRATANWALARAAGVPALAKTQFNNTWELSAVPYIPVPHLIARHCANLGKAGVSGILASWTLGGYPSPNLEVAAETERVGPDRALELVAVRRYGRRRAPLVIEAWKEFSAAFEEFPYGVAIYTIPTQHGPANLLRPKPTGAASSMILFPQDDYRRWVGPYPPEVARDQFARLAARWERALGILRQALDGQYREDLAIAEVCGLHFRSVANQIEFYQLRDQGGDWRKVVREELQLARRLFTLARRHSVIGYEASNHYYYRPLDLAEKILNCRQLLEEA